MPTYEDRDAMYAYYFYRLIGRAENTVIVYNSVTEGVSSSEKSRFLYQLLYDSDFEVEELNLSFNFKGINNEPIQIAANQSYIQRLLSRYSGQNLSPSAINTYLDCKLKFYFKYIADIKEREELKEEIDAVLFGNLFHYAMELIYEPFVQHTVEASALKLLKGDQRKIDGIVLQAIAVKYYQMNPEEASRLKLSGQSILIASHIRDYIHQLLENDIRLAPFYLESLEKAYFSEYRVGSEKIRVGGIIDRLDRTSEGIRIIDYKTGRGLKLDFKEWEQLTDRNISDRRKEIFQTLIYSDILCHTAENDTIYPAIYKLDDLFSEDFVPNVIFRGRKLLFQEVKEEFRTIFAEILSEIFSAGNIYDQTTDSKKCSYCAYNKICRR
jgi:ATP-dependent helicase/DNAse subunit B